MFPGLRRLYLFKFLVSLHFFSGVLIPFFTVWGKIQFFQIMLLQAVFQVGVVVFEVPTGAVADRIGRKYSLALGALAVCGAAVLYSFIPSFPVFVLAEVVFALGFALLSGADEAFVYDALKTQSREEQSKSILGRFGSVGLAGLMISAPLGSLIAQTAGVRYTMLAFTVPCLLGAVVALTLPEPRLSAGTRPRYLDTLGKGIEQLRTSPEIRLLVLDKITVGCLVFFIVWLYQPLLTELKVPIIYFGVVHALLTGVQIPVMRSYARLERLFGSKRRYLSGSAFLAGGALIALAFVQSVAVAVFLMMVVCAFGLTRGQLLSNYINKFARSQTRATLLSAVSVSERFLFTLLYPLVGLLVDFSLQTAFATVGALAIVAALVSRVRERHLLE